MTTLSKKDELAAPPVPRRIDADDIKRFLAVLRSWHAGRGDFVSPEVAESRASICAACPFNVKIEGCYGCNSIVPLVTKLVGGRRTKHDGKLFGCTVCGCENSSQVHFPLEVLHQGITEEMRFPEACWKKR